MQGIKAKVTSAPDPTTAPIITSVPAPPGDSPVSDLSPALCTLWNKKAKNMVAGAKMRKLSDGMKTQAFHSSEVKVRDGKRVRLDDVVTKESLKKIRLQKEPRSPISIPESLDSSLGESSAVCSVSTSTISHSFDILDESALRKSPEPFTPHGE